LLFASDFSYQGYRVFLLCDSKVSAATKGRQRQIFAVFTKWWLFLPTRAMFE
jgi:hypothetical protein